MKFKNQMEELRRLLTLANVKWYNDDIAVGNTVIPRTKFINKFGEEVSVVRSEYCLGEYFGLLEATPPIRRDLYEDVQGFLTAKQIINAWV